MNIEGPGQAPKPLPKSAPHVCTHNRLISDSVLEEEHQDGKVRCVECGSIIPDPHLRVEAKGM